VLLVASAFEGESETARIDGDERRCLRLSRGMLSNRCEGPVEVEMEGRCDGPTGRVDCKVRATVPGKSAVRWEDLGPKGFRLFVARVTSCPPR